MDQYPYLVFVLILGLIWLFFFVKRKDLRREQMLMSILVTPAALTQIWFYHDYWRPSEYIRTYFFGSIPIGLEDFLFCFFIGGIGSIVYEFFTYKNHRRGRKNHLLALAGFLSAVLVFVLLKYLELNTIWASIWALVFGAVFLVFLNRKLLPDFLWSGSIMCSLLFVIYVVWLFLFPEAVGKLWVQDGLSHIKIIGVPIEEIIWYLSWGMFSGIIYESWINVKAYPVLTKSKN